MGFPILGEIERLIDEHGSAKILSERIALAKDQYAALEKELSASRRIETASKARTEKLRAENQSLKLENKKLKQEIQRRDDIIEKEKSHKNLLPKEQISILRCLSKIPTGKMISTKQIMEACNLSEHLALYHLQELEEMSMIENKHLIDDPYWLLDHDGRGYLIKNNLMT